MLSFCTAEDTKLIALARRYAQSLEPFASGGYVHAVANEGQAGTLRAYTREKLARLTALKDRYDPENVFHLNQNIPPQILPEDAGASVLLMNRGHVLLECSG